MSFNFQNIEQINSVLLDGVLSSALLFAFEECKQLLSRSLKRFLTCIPSHEENYSVVEDPDF